MVDMVQSETSWSHEVTISYTHDPLNRLREADYSDSRQFEYTYDSVGNIISQTVDISPGEPVTTVYQYDTANRLTYVDAQQYTWDNNGNLLGDGSSSYTYDHANRLNGVSGSGITASYAYNGLGDRLQQTVDTVTTNYTLDLGTSLTQVLSDGSRTYVYGNGRISQYGINPEYYLADGLGSMRQLEFDGSRVTLAREYEPYGEVLNSAGGASTAYGYTNEYTSQGLIYLRARYYDPTIGRFMTKDTWGGNINQPMSYNAWLYVNSNPINFTDPSGHICLDPWAPSGVHFDPNRGCDYPEGSTGSFWWRRDPLGPDTAIIDMPWVDEQSLEMWKRYPNSCGAAALYMYLEGEGVFVNYDTLINQLRNERPGGYDGYCCSNGWNGAFPTPTPDPLNWCNKACVSAKALADVARKYYGLNITSGDNWTHQSVYETVRAGHPVLTLIRSEISASPNHFGHFVVIRGFIKRGWTVVFNDSYPGEAYWGSSADQRRQVGEGREADWEDFDASWASSVDPMDPLGPGGHIRWAMAVR